MKTTVTITSRSVVTLPAKLRQALGLKADDQLIAETTPEGLLLRPGVTLPLEVYTPQREREFDEAEAELAGASRRDDSGHVAAGTCAEGTHPPDVDLRLAGGRPSCRCGGG
jgi:AbrB family looped-hinge helix DNA binding protein